MLNEQTTTLRVKISRGEISCTIVVGELAARRSCI